MLYACQALLGVVVKVQLKNGSVYEGVLSAVSTKEKDFSVRLSKAMRRLDAGGKRALPNRPIEGTRRRDRLRRHSCGSGTGAGG